MKELVLKKRSEMEELCRKAHIIPDNCMLLDKSIASMDSGKNAMLCGTFNCGLRTISDFY
jgi:hypothetical protein